MRIAVDCRYLGKSGIGRVCQGIIDNFDYSANKFILIGKREELKHYKQAEIIECGTNPFSVKGLINFPKEINNSCDAFLTPNFIVPLGIQIPVYTIMHDLIFLDLKKMTKNFVDEKIKKFLLRRAVKKSKTVFCVSDFTKKRCEYYYKKYAHKFVVNYNGLSESVLNYHVTENKIKGNLVFVGNVKPHKGLKTLIEAFNGLPNDYKLKIIGEKDNFITGFDTKGVQNKNIIFTGKLSDDELLREIASAEFLIQPSEYEGFGIPPLEALYLGTKPIVSDIDVFKEVYKELPVDFFKVGNAEDLKDKILNANPQILDCREKINSLYSYRKCANNVIETIKE